MLELRRSISFLPGVAAGNFEYLPSHLALIGESCKRLQRSLGEAYALT